MKHTLTKKAFNSIETISALSHSAGIFRSICEDFDLHRIEDYQCRYLDSLGIHYNGFHQIVLVTNGTATVSINNFRCNVQANKLLFMTAGSAQKWETSEDIEGYRLVFMPKYFARFLSFGNWTFSPNIFLESSFCQMDLHARMAGEFATLMEQILLESGEMYNSNVERNEIIDQLNILILLKLKRIKPNGPVEAQSMITNESNGLRIVNDFLHLVREDFRDIEKGGSVESIKTITEFSYKLNVHPNYLNRVVHKVMGISVSELLRDIVLRKAKTFLIHSDLTISQIAYKLGFQSDSYFCFYYKKHTGITPSEYRKAARAKKSDI